MSERHLVFWPEGHPRCLTIPETSVYFNAEVAAARYPDKPYLVFYDNRTSFAEFVGEVGRLAGFLQRECQIKKGDRVLLDMQNSPQFVIGYYAILRADAVVVPVNPMNLTEELAHYLYDSGARVALAGQELLPRIAPLLGKGLDHIVVATYSDALRLPAGVAVPEAVAAPRATFDLPGVVSWHRALEADFRPHAHTAKPDDLCLMPYTSGTTGRPKGCKHSHRTMMATLVAGEYWFSLKPDTPRLATLPFFHVTGMQGSMNGPLFTGATVVLLTRWDRETAAALIARYRIAAWTAIPTLLIDFLANPRLSQYDLASLKRMAGGGAAMPAAVAQKMQDLGITYVEGYGLTETMAPSHLNPPDRPKKQCLGIPIYDVESKVVGPNFQELAPNEAGEILTRGPQVFLGYWNRPEATAEAFVELEGKRWFRTGDIGRVDEEGYFFMVDRLKRMINAAGFKVWPAEVETLLYQHPGVQEACIIAARDAHRGETVKAVVVLKDDYRGKLSAEDLIAWARDHMAAYKVPRLVSFVDALPKSGTGKVMWRSLQEAEFAKS